MEGLRAPCLTLFLALGALSCGDDSPTSPSVVQVSGTWNGTATSRGWSGGECVGTTLQAGGPLAQPFSLSITQSGSDLTASTTSPVTGTCSYTGTAASSSITLNLTSCAVSCFQFSLFERRLPRPTAGRVVHVPEHQRQQCHRNLHVYLRCFDVGYHGESGNGRNPGGRGSDPIALRADHA